MKGLDIEHGFVARHCRRFQCLQTALGHGEGVVREVDLPGVLIIFEHGEVNDPAEPEHPLLNDLQFLADLQPRSARQLVGIGGFAGGKEQPVAISKPDMLQEGGEVFGREILEHRVLA